jgi:hypothetical protein
VKQKIINFEHELHLELVLEQVIMKSKCGRWFSFHELLNQCAELLWELTQKDRTIERGERKNQIVR